MLQGRFRAALAGLALLAVTGCADGGGAGAQSPEATPTSPAPSAAPTTTGSAPPAEPAPTVTVTETAPPPPVSEAPPPSEVVRGDCSTADVPGDLPAVGVTDTVAATREVLFLAALACDYDALDAIARANPGGFPYSFGDDGDPGGYWRMAEERGDRPMFALATLLRLEPREETVAGLGDRAVWPAVSTGDATDADWQEIADVGLYTSEELDLIRSSGSGYTGWRTGIDAAGNWTFFIAGD